MYRSALALNLRGKISSFHEETHYWVLSLQNLKQPTQLLIFLDFGAKILRIAHPVNYSYLPRWFLWTEQTLLLGKYDLFLDVGKYLKQSNLPHWFLWTEQTLLLGKYDLLSDVEKYLSQFH